MRSERMSCSAFGEIYWRNESLAQSYEVEATIFDHERCYTAREGEEDIIEVKHR